MSRLYTHHRGVVPASALEAARRRLGLELRRVGVTPNEINEWAANSWWPSLRGEPVFNAVRQHVESTLVGDMTGLVWAETQIVIRLPDEDDAPVGTPHVDTLPPWAEGLKYKAIYGVELTQTTSGRTVLFPRGVLGPVEPRIRPGDVLEMKPDLWHRGSPNLGGDIRMALFFRLLEPR